MKTEQIQKCRLCGQGIAHEGNITFWTLSIQRMGLDPNAINRVAGMEQFLGGNVAIARCFVDEDIAVDIGTPDQIFICEGCAIKPRSIWDLLPERDETPDVSSDAAPIQQEPAM